MAEQDRHGSHFGANPSNPIKGASRPRMDFDALAQGSGAEVDRHGSHFSIDPENAVKSISAKWSNLTTGSGKPAASEQDRYASHFSFNSNNAIDPTAIGIFRSTLLPSIGFHSGLAVVVYAASRSANRVDGKDWLWPTGQVLNAWWCAVGARAMNDHISITNAYSNLGYTEKLLLTGVTVWGARLLYRIGSRNLARSGDDPKYAEAKRDEGFWNKAFLSIFVPEALFQAVISLPFTLPFRALDDSAAASPLHVHPEYTHGLAVALFSSGMALEFLADLQLAAHETTDKEDQTPEGVWSIVRHPNYLGDALIHASFPLLLWSAGIMHPLALLGPVANYYFLRFIGGDAENDAFHAATSEKEKHAKHAKLRYKRQKNSFWPKPEEIHNEWTWAVIAWGVGGFILERGYRGWIYR